jgi:hypothetical protein
VSRIVLSRIVWTASSSRIVCPASRCPASPGTLRKVQALAERYKPQTDTSRSLLFFKVQIDFAEIWLDAKCMPMAQRSVIGHPSEIVFVAELTPFNFFTSS